MSVWKTIHPQLPSPKSTTAHPHNQSEKNTHNRTPRPLIRILRTVRKARLARLRHRGRLHAPRVRVQRHLVRRHQVHALDDVNLAAVGPGGEWA